MNCNECKWFYINHNENYGICKRYPENQNKHIQDYCGEFIQKEVIETIIEEMAKPIREIAIDSPIEKPKRGRKPKA